NVYLYDIDDLQHIVDESLAEREKAATEIEKELDFEINEFKDWVTTLGVVPVIASLREKALDIQGETYASVLRKIPDLTEREQKVINKYTKSIVNQLLKEPIIQVKEMAGRKNSAELLSLFVEIFGLDEEIKKEVVKRSKKVKSIAPLKKAKRVTFPTIEQ